MPDFINPFTHITRIQISYQNKVPKKDRISIATPHDASIALRIAWDEKKIELVEEFKIICLDISKRCLGVADISQGGITSCPVDVKIVFATALLARASKIILAHNHPSGSAYPSRSDFAVTRQMMRAGDLLNIQVYDHLIMTPTEYYSLRDNHQMPRL